MCGRPQALIKNLGISYLVEGFPAGDLTNTASGLLYILIPDNKKSNEVKKTTKTTEIEILETVIKFEIFIMCLTAEEILKF